MLTGNVWWFAVAITGGGGWGFWYGFRALAKSRTVENTPPARIRSAAQGYAVFHGLGAAPPGTTIRGPLTGRPCIWWHYEIEERGSGRSGEWNRLDEQTSDKPFLLDDSTGQCLVDPQGADVIPHARIVWRGSTPWPEYRLPPTGGVLGAVIDRLLSGGRYRYTERRLEAGMPVYALGEFRTLGGVSLADPEDGVVQVLHDWKANQANLLQRFDSNHDGRIDAAEWEAARAAARAEVMQKRKARELEPAVPTLGEPGDGRAFLLSGSEPQALVRRFRWQAAGGITLFVGSAAALAALLRALA